MRGPNNVASIPERIRGCIAIALTIACFSFGANVTNQAWQAGFIVSGMLYMLTALAIVFDKYDGQ